MRIVLTLLVALILFGSFQAIADTDRIGIYFDVEAEEVCLDSVDPLGIFTTYLAITNPTAADIASIQVGLRAEGDASRLGVDWYMGWTGIDWIENDYFCMQYGFNEPAAIGGPVLLLARYNYMLVGDGGAAFHLAGISGAPEYHDSLGTAYPLDIVGGGVQPAAVVNRECDIVSNTLATFGRVKSLYR